MEQKPEKKWNWKEIMILNPDFETRQAYGMYILFINCFTKFCNK